MNTRKILIIDIDYNNNPDVDTKVLKPQVVDGFTLDELKDNMTISEGYVPNDKDKIFIFPGCTVPRNKLRDKYTNTIKPSKADAAFINTEAVDSSDTTFKVFNRARRFKQHLLTPFLQNAYDQVNAQLIASLVKAFNIEDIYFTRNAEMHAWDSKTIKQVIGDINWGDLRNLYAYRESGEITVLSVPKSSEISQMTCNIYDQKEILADLNEDSIVIDEERYEELRAFFKTREHDNVVLGMELMANSDYNRSMVYLLLLIKEYGQVMYDKARKEIDHVNFKSLMNILDISRRDLQYSRLQLSDLTQVLKDTNMFTKSNVLLLAKAFAHDYFNEDDPKNAGWNNRLMYDLEEFAKLPD